jgi:hypothetical protein
LRSQTGFVDETVILSDTEPNRILTLSFRNTREDAQRYEREQFDTVQKTVQHLLETAPVVQPPVARPTLRSQRKEKLTISAKT